MHPNNHQLQNLNQVDLLDGLSTRLGDDEVRYRKVKLRPATVAMDLEAVRIAERVVRFEGKPMLLLSDAVYRIAMTMQRIERFCTSAGLDDIDSSLIDLNTMGRLTPHDLERIEQQILLMDLAENVRYGNLSTDEFDAIINGTHPQSRKTPQPTGEPDQLDERAGESRPAIGRLD